jgi:hypothetical protein
MEVYYLIGAVICLWFWTQWIVNPKEEETESKID